MSGVRVGDPLDQRCLQGLSRPNKHVKRNVHLLRASSTLKVLFLVLGVGGDTEWMNGFPHPISSQPLVTDPNSIASFISHHEQHTAIPPPKKLTFSNNQLVCYSFSKKTSWITNLYLDLASWKNYTQKTPPYSDRPQVSLLLRNHGGSREQPSFEPNWLAAVERPNSQKQVGACIDLVLCCN